MTAMVVDPSRAGGRAGEVTAYVGRSAATASTALTMPS
jgi:hypothetical protein